ncbi:MAG: DUF1330 domain-containing protein [Gammaproteobacteria bacterium]|nr:DUF1330 domain-containing protein [Gammaproteobacteria bacterium]
MNAYLVVDIDVTDPEQYQGYVKKAPAFVEKHGGKYIVRGGDTKLVEGDWHPGRFVVVEFPSRERAQAFLDDSEYQAVADIRRASTSSNMILVEGFDGI